MACPRRSGKWPVANAIEYVGSRVDASVYALNASTGQKLWTFPTAGIVDSSPAVAKGVVYVGSDDSNVYALNARTGAKLWSFPTGSQVRSSPVVANGMVYVSGYVLHVFDLAGGQPGVAMHSNPTRLRLCPTTASSLRNQREHLRPLPATNTRGKLKSIRSPQPDVRHRATNHADRAR